MANNYDPTGPAPRVDLPRSLQQSGTPITTTDQVLQRAHEQARQPQSNHLGNFRLTDVKVGSHVPSAKGEK
jgi:hypothetical protein